MSFPIVSLTVNLEPDIVSARQRARQLAALLGFDRQDQVRISTAVSEIARNAFRYGGGGRVEFAVDGRTRPQLLRIVVSDEGPGFAHVDEVLAGRYRSTTGMGVGITGSRRLMDRFGIDSAVGRGTVVTMARLLPPHAPLLQREHLAGIAERLAAQQPQTAIDEVQEQNRELLRAFDELRQRHEELVRLNGELEDTNRGVVALYAELDERADHLRRADEMKSKFLSNMSHEFRTPLNSMLALTRLLLDRVDGELTGEQELQVTLIRRAAEDLSELVNDLLDLAKVEAGKIVVHPTEFEVANLFGALRGMLRPLLVNESLTLVFDEPEGVPTLYTDEAKVSQVLRNFVSNALKFTERGEVRVSVRHSTGDGLVTFAVADTGIGIAPEDQDRIFLEFTQLEHPLQRRVRGTGLGLPLSKKLAELLGGRLSLTSTPGVGSTFALTIPARLPQAGAQPSSEEVAQALETGRRPLLVLEDAADAVLLYESYLRGLPYRVISATSVGEARRLLHVFTPAAIILDIVLRHEDSWRFLADLKADPRTSAIPILVISALDDEQKGLALGADAYAVKPVEPGWLRATLAHLTGVPLAPLILLIDDDRGSRYVLRRLIVDSGCTVIEATDGTEGLRLARDEHPAVIFLDLLMPGLTGPEVIERLRSDPETRDIPVVIATSKPLTPAEHQQLAGRVSAIVPKNTLTGAAARQQVRDALARAGLVNAA